MDNKKGMRPETLAVAYGYDPEMGMGSVKSPIFMTSTFVYPSAQHAKDVHEAYFDGSGPLMGETNHIYSRLGHPGLDFLEKRLAAIDGAEEAVAFSSGMAAHSSIALAHVRPGDSVLHGRPIYGGVDMLYNSIMPQFGSHAVAYLDGTDEAGVRAAAAEAIANGPLKLIIAETPANPTAAIVDLDLMVRIADEVGAKQGHRPLVVVDNTLLGPFAQRPIEHGVDLCLTSLTKYCGGHSDLLIGLCVTTDDGIYDRLVQARTFQGATPGALEAFLALRGLRTMPVRLAAMQRNAIVLVERLRIHPAVAEVRYPGEGAMVSFVVNGGADAADALCDGVRILVPATSLGGVETTIERRQKYAGDAHVPPGLLRMSVGIEDVEDLWADISDNLSTR